MIENVFSIQVKKIFLAANVFVKTRIYTFLSEYVNYFSIFNVEYFSFKQKRIDIFG